MERRCRGADDAEAVWRVFGDEDSRPGLGGDGLVADLELNATIEDLKHLVLARVDVERDARARLTPLLHHRQPPAGILGAENDPQVIAHDLQFGAFVGGNDGGGMVCLLHSVPQWNFCRVKSDCAGKSYLAFALASKKHMKQFGIY